MAGQNLDKLREDILSGVPGATGDDFVLCDLREFEDMVYTKDGKRVYDNAIMAALAKYKAVEIPLMDTLYLAEPIIMRSGYRLRLGEGQHIANVPGVRTCLVRNQSIANAASRRAVHEDFDTDISVEGGIWDGSLPENAGEESRLGTGMTPEFKGALAIMIFVNIENLVISDAEFVNGGICYGVQLGNIRHFRISGLKYMGYGRDGVHVNGPAAYGEICNLRGQDLGDDIIALNAWDWDTSAITFGTIEKMYVHDNRTSNNELRLLPGRKMYEDDFVDCHVRDCILERLSGIYTFKLYCQPNIFNAEIDGYHDASGTVGNIYNVWFSDIDIDCNRSDGFHGLPINGIFDICADCHDLHFCDIRIPLSSADIERAGMRFVSVGPLSAVWKNGSDNPEDWGEVFDPDAVCHAEDLYFDNICFADGVAKYREDLVREITMTINPHYPATTPRGGTGYGKIGRIYIGGKNK